MGVREGKSGCQWIHWVVVSERKLERKRQMKKKLPITIGSIVVLLLVLTLVAPHFILMADRQEKKADEYAYSEVFFDEYDEVRAHLLEVADSLKAQGIETQVYSYPIEEAEELYIDSIYLPSKEN